MKLVFALLASLLITSSAYAQAIHGHPQKTFYSSPAEWPFFSAQSDWKPSNTAGDLGHTHVECNVPAWAETTLDPFTVPCQIQLFHVAGRITWFNSHFTSKAEWYRPDGTKVRQSSQFPPFEVRGNPNGLVIVRVDVTIDPRLSEPVDSNERNTSSHGWWSWKLYAETTFDNGVQNGTFLFVPFFSVIDTSKPIPWWANTPRVAAQSSPIYPFRAEYAELGATFLPVLAPISSPVSFGVAGWTYGVLDFMPPGITEVIIDADRHNGVPGQKIFTATGTNSVGGIITLDPTTLGAGTHRVAVSWERNFEDMKSVTWLVINVKVGDDVPPPPPPPPPTDVWENVIMNFQRLGDSIRICASDSKCLVLGTVN